MEQSHQQIYPSKASFCSATRICWCVNRTETRHFLIILMEERYDHTSSFFCVLSLKTPAIKISSQFRRTNTRRRRRRRRRTRGKSTPAKLIGTFYLTGYCLVFPLLVCWPESFLLKQEKQTKRLDPHLRWKKILDPLRCSQEQCEVCLLSNYSAWSSRLSAQAEKENWLDCHSVAVSSVAEKRDGFSSIVEISFPMGLKTTIIVARRREAHAYHQFPLNHIKANRKWWAMTESVFSYCAFSPRCAHCLQRGLHYSNVWWLGD